MSNVIAGTLTIIDGSCNTIVKSILVGKRPFKIAVMDSSKICVACDRSNSILVVDCLSNDINKISMPNDGNIEIDKSNMKMFISNTSEIIIYDLVGEKIISNIIGFVSITALKLSIDSSKLYVLDKLLSEFRIYGTDNYKLIDSINNIGTNPGYFLISKDDKTAYISMGNNILILDIYNKKSRTLSLHKNSIITGMLLNGNILYVANKGLRRIELIDIEKYKIFDFILTSMPEPNRICLAADETKLLVANRNVGGFGSIDIIDTTTNQLISSVLLDSNNSQPYDVISVSLGQPEINQAPVEIIDLEANKEPLIIITKKVFACYREDIDFSNLVVRLSDKNASYTIEKIKFEDGSIVNGSEIRSSIEELPGFSSIQFILRINYTIYFLGSKENRGSFKGFLEKNENIIVAIPKGRDVNEFELKLKTTSRLKTASSLIDNVVRFGVLSSLEVKIISEDEILIQNFQQTVKLKTYGDNLNKIEEHFETFLGFSGSIFPEGTVFPYLNESDE